MPNTNSCLYNANNPQNSKDSDNKKRPSKVAQFGLIDADNRQKQFEVKRNYRQQIHQIQRLYNESEFLVSCKQTEGIFDGEEGNANSFNEQKHRMLRSNFGVPRLCQHSSIWHSD